MDSLLSFRRWSIAPVLYLVVLVLQPVVALGAAPGENRQRALELRLMAPCCYNGSVALHQSDAAKEMRTEIAAQIAQGKSDRQILDLYIKRYGRRILAEPEGAMGVVLCVIPWVSLLLGLSVVILVVKRLRRTTPQPAGQPANTVDVPDDLW